VLGDVGVEISQEELPNTSVDMIRNFMSFK
jgi:hypothetical protein